MTAIDERAGTEQVTREELALARAVLDGLPVDGPLVRSDVVMPTQRGRERDPVADAAGQLLEVLEDGRDRLARLAALLDAASAESAVLR